MSIHQKKQARLFHIPLSYGSFTENLLRESISSIEGNNYSGILYLAPTPRKIKDAQRLFHKLANSAYIPPEMMTIKQFSKRLYSLHGDKTLISKPLMPIVISRLSGKGIGFSSIISGLIDEIKQYRPDKDIESIQNELTNIFSELNVPEEGSKRAMNAIEIFRAYQEILNRQNALDENDVMIECPRLIEKYAYTFNALIIDGFYEITPVEELILKKLIENSSTALISMPYDDSFHGITSSVTDFFKKNFNLAPNVLSAEKRRLNSEYISYPGIDEEVEGIARHIKNLFISGKNRHLDNIIISFPKLHIYADIVQRVFKRYGIPYSLSMSKPAGKTRPFLDLIAMLESIAEDFPRLTFSQFLISPCFSGMPEPLRRYIPRICLNSGIINGKDSWLNLTRTHTDLPVEMEKELKRIFKKLALLESIKNTGTYRQFCEILHRLLSELDFSAGDADFKEKIADIFRELSFIDNLTKPCHAGTGSLETDSNGLRSFIDSLRHILNSTDIEIEGAGVQVTDFFDLRVTATEYLYLGGLKDGDLPSMPEIDHILPDNVRTKLGLVNMKRYLQLQQFIFQWLIDSSKNFHLSYPAMEGDKLFLPSPFLPWKAEAAEKMPGIFCKEEELLRSGKIALSSRIKEIADIKTDSIKKRFGRNSCISVTDIDSYRTCPRKFLIEKMLNLEPPETKEYEIDAMLLGTIIHKAMESLISSPFKGYDEMKANAENFLTKILNKYSMEDYWKNLIKDSFLSILPEVYDIESELKEEGYFFMKAEAPIEGEIIEGIKLKGKIDRVDKKGDIVELIDYKTGSAQLSGSQVIKNGATLQLFLYAALMKSLGFNADRVGIYSLKDIKITWIPGRNDKREGRTIEEYITASLRYLDETVTKIRNGDFTALPLNEQTCRNCHERPYCPYIQTSS